MGDFIVIEIIQRCHKIGISNTCFTQTHPDNTSQRLDRVVKQEIIITPQPIKNYVIMLVGDTTPLWLLQLALESWYVGAYML
jgi:hypothetical protein